MRPLLVLLLAASACAHAAHPAIRTTGEGRVTARPDLASVTLGVESLAKALPDAVKDSDARMRAVLAALAQAGIPERDVHTTRYDVALEQRYEPNAPPQPVGYRVTHELRVLVRGGEPGRAGVVLDAALGAGATVVRSIAFEKEDPAPERARALEAAVAAARAKAEVIARASGRTLGEVRAVSEAGVGPIVPLRTMNVAKLQSATPVQPGELEIAAQVEVEFGLR